jgi:hypothetical protein
MSSAGALSTRLGPRVKTAFVEAVAEGPDSERVMRDLVAQGASWLRHSRPRAGAARGR